MGAVRARVESLDVRAEAEDVVQHGPFLVAFLTHTENADGRRVGISVCAVNRMDDGKVVEIWNLRGTDPVPADAG